VRDKKAKLKDNAGHNVFVFMTYAVRHFWSGYRVIIC